MSGSKIALFFRNLRYQTLTLRWNAARTWITDARTSIIKEEGEGLYNEYVPSMFRTYLTVDNEEFVDAIKVEKRLWTQAK